MRVGGKEHLRNELLLFLLLVVAFNDRKEMINRKKIVIYSLY